MQDDGELVVTCSEATPLPEQVELSFGDVAAAVVDCVEGRWAPTAGTAAFAVPGLIGRLGITAVMPRLCRCTSVFHPPREQSVAW
jgi:hypothetical protein